MPPRMPSTARASAATNDGPVENSPTSAIVISSPNWVQCESGKVPSPLKKALIRAGRTDDRPESRKEGSFSLSSSAYYDGPVA